MNTLVVYYSLSGNTKILAEQLAQVIGSPIFELKEADKTGVVLGAMKAIMKKPSQLAELPDLNGVDTLYLGHPVWAGTMPPALTAFLSKVDLQGIAVRGFATMKGDSSGHSAKDMAEIVRKLSGKWEGMCAHRVASKDFGSEQAAQIATNWMADWENNSVSE